MWCVGALRDWKRHIDRSCHFFLFPRFIGLPSFSMASHSQLFIIFLLSPFCNLSKFREVSLLNFPLLKCQSLSPYRCHFCLGCRRHWRRLVWLPICPCRPAFATCQCCAQLRTEGWRKGCAGSSRDARGATEKKIQQIRLAVWGFDDVWGRLDPYCLLLWCSHT